MLRGWRSWGNVVPTNILEGRLCCLFFILPSGVFTTWLWDHWTLLLKVKLQVYSLISRQACSVDFFSLPLVIGIDRLTDDTVVKLLGLPLRRPHCWVNTGFCEGLFYSNPNVFKLKCFIYLIFENLPVYRIIFQTKYSKIQWILLFCLLQAY